MSDKVVKHGFAEDYHLWEAPSSADKTFSPMFSFLADGALKPDGAFSKAKASKASKLNQEQAGIEDWQAFSVPSAQSSSGSVVEDSFSANKAVSPPQTPQTAEQISQSSHSKLVDVGYQEGYSKGYDEGFVLGESEGKSEGRHSAMQLCKQESQTLEEQRKLELDAVLVLLSKVTDTLADALLQPMQNLVLHLAKEVVRGELSLSSKAIERLITLSMEQLHTTQSNIQVYLNPLDFERLQHYKAIPEQVVLQPSHEVSVGSIKLEHEGSWVEDLLEQRLAQISQQAFGFVDAALVAPIQTMVLQTPPKEQLDTPVDTPVDTGQELDELNELKELTEGA